MSIRRKFNIGITLFFAIIAITLGLSVIQINSLSKKTSLILKENYFSVTYARDMSEGLTKINQEITSSFLSNKDSDSTLIDQSIIQFDRSLLLEKKNITEVGEDKLVAEIESHYNEYHDSVMTYRKMPGTAVKVLQLQSMFSALNQQIMSLSQMNEKAIEVKTNDAKTSANKALTQMLIFGTVCFLITLSFTFRFASYFNDRFFQLYSGIKEIAANNYGQRLHFEGKDEFSEISLVFNNMAEKLNQSRQNTEINAKGNIDQETGTKEIQELKTLLARIKNIEEQAIELFSRLEKKR